MPPDPRERQPAPDQATDCWRRGPCPARHSWSPEGGSARRNGWWRRRAPLSRSFLKPLGPFGRCVLAGFRAPLAPVDILGRERGHDGGPDNRLRSYRWSLYSLPRDDGQDGHTDLLASPGAMASITTLDAKTKDRTPEAF